MKETKTQKPIKPVGQTIATMDLIMTDDLPTRQAKYNEFVAELASVRRVAYLNGGGTLRLIYLPKTK